MQFLNVLVIKPAANWVPYIGSLTLTLELNHLLLLFSLLADHAAGVFWKAPMDVLMYFWHKVTTRIYCNCCKSELTTAAVLHKGTSYKLFKATSQASSPTFHPLPPHFIFSGYIGVEQCIGQDKIISCLSLAFILYCMCVCLCVHFYLHAGIVHVFPPRSLCRYKYLS